MDASGYVKLVDFGFAKKLPVIKSTWFDMDYFDVDILSGGSKDLDILWDA